MFHKTLDCIVAAGEDPVAPGPYSLSACISGKSPAKGGGQGKGRPGTRQRTANSDTVVSHTLKGDWVGND